MLTFLIRKNFSSREKHLSLQIHTLHKEDRKWGFGCPSAQRWDFLKHSSLSLHTMWTTSVLYKQDCSHVLVQTDMSPNSSLPPPTFLIYPFFAKVFWIVWKIKYDNKIDGSKGNNHGTSCSMLHCSNVLETSVKTDKDVKMQAANKPDNVHCYCPYSTYSCCSRFLMLSPTLKDGQMNACEACSPCQIWVNVYRGNIWLSFLPFVGIRFYL